MTVHARIADREQFRTRHNGLTDREAATDQLAINRGAQGDKRRVHHALKTGRADDAVIRIDPGDGDGQKQQ